MALADRLAQPRPRGRGHSCTVGFLLVELASQGGTDSDDYNALVDSLRSRSWTATDLAAQIQLEDVRIDVRHLRQHRAGACTSANCPNPNIGRL